MPAVTVTKEFTKLENSAAKMTITVAQKDVAENYNQKMKEYAKNIQIPGFRKGHVPVKILEQKFGEALKNEIAGDLVNNALQEVLSNEEDKSFERPLSYAAPELESIPEFDVNKDFVFTVKYDVFPAVEVKNLDGIVVKEPEVTIGDKELEEELKNVQERNAVVVDRKDDDAAEKGNIVTVSYFEIGDDGKEVEGTKRDDYVFTLGAEQNLYKLDDDIIGMKKGETKLVTKTYAADDKNENLAGKTKKFSVTVSALKIRNLPALDDDLAQDVNDKYKTLDDMKKDILHNMEVAKDQRIAEIKSNSLIKQLIEKNPVTVPATMLSAELEMRWRQVARQYQTTPEQLDKLVAASGQSKEDMLKQWTGDAEEQIKGELIVSELIKARGIDVTEEEVEAEYTKLSERTGMSVEDIKKQYASEAAKNYLMSDVKTEKLLNQLYSEVKVEKGEKIAFADLFKEM